MSKDGKLEARERMRELVLQEQECIHRIEDIKKEKMMILYRVFGLTDSEIAKSLGIDRGIVYCWRLRQGLPEHKTEKRTPSDYMMDKYGGFHGGF